WLVHLRRGFRVELIYLYISSYPDYFAPALVAIADAYSLADRIFIGEIMPGHSFIDDGYARRCFPVLFGERPAFQNRYPHCPKIIVADRIIMGAGHIGRGQRRPAVDYKSPPVIPGRRNANSRAGRLHAGQGLDALKNLLEESRLLIILTILEPGQRDFHRQDVLGIISGAFFL